jgi:hypothetical protein
MNLFDIENWRPRRIAIAGVRFATGGTIATETPAAPAEKPAEKPAETPADKPAEAPVDKPVDKPADAPADKPAEDKPAAPDDAQKVTDDKPEDGGKGKKAPDAYTLKVSDEAKEFIADDDRVFLEEVGKANDWTNEEAQAELDAHVERTKAKLAKQADEWAKATKADPVYGGEQLKETQRLARKALDTLRPEGHPRRDSFMRFLDRGGAGNHIEVVSMLADLGKILSEDAPNHGGPKPEEKKILSDAEAIFGKR